MIPCANYVIEVHNIDTKEKYTDPFIKPLVSNELQGFYHEQIVNE